MSRPEKWIVWATSLIVTVSGAGLMWVKYFVEPSDPWAVVNHPLQIWFLKLHILSSPLLVFALGLITTRHIWFHYRSRVRRGRLSGSASALLATPMVLTGYLVQLVTHQGWLRATAFAHIAFGLLFALGLSLHQAVVRQRRSVGVQAQEEAFANLSGGEAAEPARVDHVGG